MLHLFCDMRVLSTFITMLLIILLLVTGGFFVAREMILYWGVSSFKDSLRNLELQAQNGSYVSRCQNESQLFSGEIQVETHLRFTSDTEYVLEATCDQISTRPILISKNELPPFITKVPGTSGIIWSNGRSAIELEVFRGIVGWIAKVANINVSFLEKSRIIGIEGKSITVFDKETRDLGLGPVTVCEGYGYQCCKAETQVGVGESILGLRECNGSCFSSCASRPVVLSFSTLPFYEAATRQLTIKTGTMVDFNYVVDAPDSSGVQVSVDFGDGTPAAYLDTDAGKLTHQYKCSFPSCTYQAKISVVDSWQVTSFEGPISMITVVVNQ